MDDKLPGDDWLEKRLAALGWDEPEQTAPVTPPTPDKVWDKDLIPDLSTPKSKEDLEMDSILNRIDIMEAYQRWVTKFRPIKRQGQKESIQISCPNPAHTDVHPSAWINTDKQVYNCGACVEGGDKYHIAAYHFGMPVPGYQTADNGRMFRELKNKMVESLGYRIQKSLDTSLPATVYLPQVYNEKPVPPPEWPDQTPYIASLEDENKVVPIRAIQEVVKAEELKIEEQNAIDLSDLQLPTLDWRAIVTPGTFLDEYMNACIIDDAAEEYHFWNGMLAIGLAVGRDVTLFDIRKVYANLLLCVLGRTGERKSRSMGHLLDLIRLSLPFDRLSGMSDGIKIIQSVASGEQLIAEYDQKIPSPTNPKLLIPGSPVRGLTIYGELSDLSGRAARQGSVIKGTIMSFADAENEISTSSRTGGELRAVEPFFCAATTTQPESLKDLLKEGDTTSGFLNRWIFASGKPKTKVAIGGAQVDIKDAAAALLRLHTQRPRVIQWSEDAKKLFTEHFHSTIEPVQKTGPIMGRLDLLEKKLILLLTINEGGVGLTEVPVEIVHKVISMHRYLVDAYGITQANMQYQTENNKIYADIMRQIERLSENNQYGPTAKNIRDRLANKSYDVRAFGAILKLIADESGSKVEVNQGDPHKPGRKTEHYKWTG